MLESNEFYASQDQNLPLSLVFLTYRSGRPDPPPQIVDRLSVNEYVKQFDGKNFKCFSKLTKLILLMVDS